MKKNLILTGALFTTLILTIAFAQAHPTAVDEDGMLLVNQKRTFIIGLYQEAPDERFAAETAKTGFNLIRCTANQESLDRAQAQGLNAWIPLGGIAVSDDDQAKKLSDLVKQYQSHPALAVWEGPDEILWNVWWSRINQAEARWKQLDEAIRKYSGNPESVQKLKQLQTEWRRYRESARYTQAEEVEGQIRKLLNLPAISEKLSTWPDQLEPLLKQLQRGTQTVRQTDPNHVIWFNHAPRNTMKDLTTFGTVADIVGCDIYPVPFGPQVGHSDLAERNLPCVGAFTRRMAQSAPHKPVWMVLQGFGWDDLNETPSPVARPQPTLPETRFMAYDAVVNGARGILYWGTFAMKPNAPLWGDLKTVVSELRDLQPFLSARDVNRQFSLQIHPNSGSDEKGIVWLAKAWNGRLAFLIVNEADQALAFDVSGLKNLDGSKIQVLNDVETLEVKDGKFTYGLPGQGVGVLVTKGKE